MADLVVTVFVEGDTEVDFYKKLVTFLREKNGGHLSCKVDVKNVKGVGNYQSKVNRVFLYKVANDILMYLTDKRTFENTKYL